MFYRMKEKRAERKYRRQRADRGYSDYDVLDLQMWFIRTLRAMLENVATHLCSYPDSITFEEWKDILQEMVSLLNVMEADCENNEARSRFFELFSKWFWDIGY